MNDLTCPKPLAITMGDAAGIGPEIIAKAFAVAPDSMDACFVVGDVMTLRRAAALVATRGRPRLPVAWIASPSDAASVPRGCIPVLPAAGTLAQVAWGRISALAGAYAGQCVMWAADAALRGEVAGLVTAPLHKEAMSAAGEPFHQFPGHTELLQDRTARFLGKCSQEVPVRMMLASDELRTVLVSIHVSLRHALDAVTFDNVLQTIQITHRALERLLGRTPRIGVAGLNPHAGEGGLFGREEIDIIGPAVAAACAQGCDASGPWPPDTVFMRARHTPHAPGAFDAVVAMYHDQGLIPVKYLGVDKGVNVTLGLPFVRTSPDHGTAFDIAGTGKADPSSLLEAVRLARSLGSGQLGLPRGAIS